MTSARNAKRSFLSKRTKKKLIQYRTEYILRRLKNLGNLWNVFFCLRKLRNFRESKVKGLKYLKHCGGNGAEAELLKGLFCASFGRLIWIVGCISWMGIIFRDLRCSLISFLFHQLLDYSSISPIMP